MSVSVKYIDSPVGAQESAVSSANSTQPFGSEKQLVSGSADIPWATLVPGGWKLDGSGRLLDENPKDVGWWSQNISGNDGFFETPPVISISFSEPYTATGITFMFWPSLDHWCSEINVSWYNGQTLLAQSHAYPDESNWLLNQTVESFDKITVELLSTNKPLQFAKIQQIHIGQVVLFLQDEIVKVGLLNEIDPSLCELSADSMTIEIRDKKERSLIPQKNQEMQLFRDGNQIATHYIVDSSREAQRYYTFRCQSAIGMMENSFLGGIYDEYPLNELLSDVMTNIPFSIDDSFLNCTITGYLPVCKQREALQQIAFAVGAVVSTQGDGVVKLLPLQEKVSATFKDSDIFTGAKVVREEQTSSVQLYVHSYAKSTDEDVLIDNEAVDGEGVLFVFDEPHYDYVISGGIIESFGDNWISITASGNVTLSAKKYIHSISTRTKKNPFATSYERGNVVSVESATLVNSKNASTVLNRLYDAHKLKNVLTEDVVVSEQKVGQKVASGNPWGTKTEGYITSMESEFTKTGQTASIKIRGAEKESFAATYYSGDLYSGETEALY